MSGPPRPGLAPSRRTRMPRVATPAVRIRSEPSRDQELQGTRGVTEASTVTCTSGPAARNNGSPLRSPGRTPCAPPQSPGSCPRRRQSEIDDRSGRSEHARRRWNQPLPCVEQDLEIPADRLPDGPIDRLLIPGGHAGASALAAGSSSIMRSSMGNPAGCGCGLRLTIGPHCSLRDHPGQHVPSRSHRGTRA